MKIADKFIAKFKNKLIFYKKLISDPNTPKLSKILLGLAIAYALSPVDLIPDFIPVIGHLDDIIIVPALITAAIWLIPKSQIERIKKEMNA
ncbi:MAG: DUF1232 domain-containing protein [Candidatus Omnitrophica bacterium]|nr:DUF1232 domain-containing protein [Candidatus Omnitrophota bacterium]